MRPIGGDSSFESFLFAHWKYKSQKLYGKVFERFDVWLPRAHLDCDFHYPARLDDQTWTDFLYMRSNTKGVYAERWRHARGCGRFFNALRDTTTDHFLATYKSGEPQPGGAT